MGPVSATRSSGSGSAVVGVGRDRGRAVALALAGAQGVERDVAGDAGDPGTEGLALAEAISSLERPPQSFVRAVLDVGVIAARPRASPR